MDERELRAAFRSTVLASPPQPPMSPDAAVYEGHAALRRRRDRWVAVGAAAGVAALAFGTALAAPVLGPRQEVDPATSPTPTLTVTATPVPTPTVPTGAPWPTGPDGTPQPDRTATAGPRFEAGKHLFEVLLAAVPEEYAVHKDGPQGTLSMDHQANFDGWVGEQEVWTYLAAAAVGRDGREGQLLVEVHTAGNGLPADACTLTASFWGMGGKCQVMHVAGKQVGVAVEPTDDPRFDQWAAYRHADDVVVFVAQARRSESSRPPLAKLPLTAEELARWATDERFHLR